MTSSAQHPPLPTVGHGTASQEDFKELLARVGVQSLVDVRIAPGSRKFPRFGKDLLAQWLPAAGVSYRWEKMLGGFRKFPADSPDVALRNDSFRAYAAYIGLRGSRWPSVTCWPRPQNSQWPSCAARPCGGGAIAG
jgi:uncharacterized protein (DUF488 family)